MKDRIVNGLLLLTVGAALVISLRGSPSEIASFSEAPPVTVSPAATEAPLDRYRARRTQERAWEQAALQSILKDDGADADIQARARAQLMETAENAETELAVEAALAAWGEGQGVCVVRAGEITVFLSHPLTELQAGQLTDLIRKNGGFSEDQIRISAF